MNPGQTSRRLKVAVLNRSFARRSGGAESYSVNVVEQLADTHDLHVFAQEIDHTHPKVTYHLIFKPFNRLRWLNQIWFSYATWRQTREGFDVVHSHEHVWHGQVQTLHVRLLKYNLITSRQGLARWKSRLKLATSLRLWTYWLLEAARLKFQINRVVVAVSQTLKDEVAQSYPHALSMTQVIAPGVDLPFASWPEVVQARASQRTSARQAWGVPEAAPVVLFVANDFHRKGLDALLQALTQLDGAAHLVVVGQARDRATYEALRDRLGLSERVHFVGAQQSMTEQYLAADVLAHPTLGDTWGMVVVEAMACGLPVVVSAGQWCGVSAELTHRQQALLLLDPHEPDRIARRLAQVLQQEVAVDAMSQNAWRFAQGYSWQQVASAHANLYAKVARA